jgi:hypothetical protein
MTTIDASARRGENTATGNLVPTAEKDPYAALDDLMCVIEILCPVWPQHALTARWTVAIL